MSSKQKKKAAADLDSPVTPSRRTALFSEMSPGPTSVDDPVPVLKLDKLMPRFPKSIGRDHCAFVSMLNLQRAKAACGDLAVLQPDQSDGQDAIVVRLWPLDKIDDSTIRLSLHGALAQSSVWQASMSIRISQVIPALSNAVQSAVTVTVQVTLGNEAVSESSLPAPTQALLTQNLVNRHMVVGQECVLAMSDSQCFNIKCLSAAAASQSDLSTSMSALSLSSAPAVYFVNDNTKIVFSGPAAAIEIEQNLELNEDGAFDNIGGLKAQIESVREMVELPLKSPQLFTQFGLNAPKGVLLFGPPGTGKTLIARAIAKQSFAKFFSIDGPEIVSKFVGETEAKLRQVFTEAAQSAPSVIFIDEIDALCPKRDESFGSDDLQKRVVASLLTLMDGVGTNGSVIVLAATNLPNSIDAALRRPGRFDREIEIGIPNVAGRLQILHIFLSKMPHSLLAADIEFVASQTHGFVGADLKALCREAALLALTRHQHATAQDINLSLTSLCLQRSDLIGALSVVRPSAMREVSVEVPRVHWTDIGGQVDVKKRLQEAVEWPLLHPEAFTRLGIQPPKGILLYGPPGCSKTLMAKALATECSRNFIAVKGPELFNKYVGESEKAIRDIFRKARANAPSLVFFDEIDSIAVKRGASDGDRVGDRVLNQLLTELDGVESLKDVTVLAATNRPDIIDPALLRPGRIDRVLYVSPPDAVAREDIFRIETRKMPLAADVVLHELAASTDDYSGAEISAVCRRAAFLAMEENLNIDFVCRRHFIEAIRQTPTRITKEMIQFYMDYQAKSSLKGV